MRRRTISVIEMHRDLQARIRQVEHAPSPRTLEGIHLRIDGRRLDRAGDERRLISLRYAYTLAPNTIRARVTISTASPPGVKYQPTRNLGHELLAHASPRRIADLGPYRLVPRRWDVLPFLVTNTPTFEFHPTAGWWANHTRQWHSALPQTEYEPEEYNFMPIPGHHRFERVGPAARASPPNDVWIQRRVNQARARIIGAAPPAIHAAMTSRQYRLGDVPRPLRSLRAEENRVGPGDGHTISRHVLTRSGDIRSRRELALRAAFSRIPASRGPLALHPTAGGVPLAGRDRGTASAWAGLQAAQSEAARLDERLRPNWTRHRLEIAEGRNVELRFRRTMPIVAYRCTNGVPWGPTEYPAYLGMGPGLRPVSPDDLTSAEWLNWVRRAARLGQTPDPRPLSVDASHRGSRVFARIVAHPGGPGGWYLNSMFPIW
jgi:hypothetical protein